jgi:hypothetical protein
MEPEGPGDTERPPDPDPVPADLLPTGTFMAVSPFITGSVLGSLFAFTAVSTKRTQFWSG